MHLPADRSDIGLRSPLNQGTPISFNIAGAMMRGFATDTQPPMLGRIVDALCGNAGEIISAGPLFSSQ